MDYFLVDTDDGLQIVPASESNYCNSNYAVQLVGSKEECLQEMQRLQADYDE